jgi:polysaccharide export outer membrane protein
MLKRFVLPSCRRAVGAGLLALAVLAAGCQSGPFARKQPPKPANDVQVPAQTLGPGDVIKISFPGAPNLESTQPIRRDGRINLVMVGEVVAADKTPAQLETELVQLFSTQLVSKEIKVTVISSSFAVFVIGAVMRPGKISPDRAITAFEAVMEAGGFDNSRADMKSVRVIRSEGGTTVNFTLNLKTVLDGKPGEPFFLKSYDTVYVPEKVVWF